MEKSTKGGKRHGAGRPKGSRNKATIAREINTVAEIARVIEFAEQNEPLRLEQIASMSEIDVMRHAMLLAGLRQDWNAAASLAKEIAPYRFAKLSAVQTEISDVRGIKDLSDAELLEMIGPDGDGEDC